MLMQKASIDPPIKREGVWNEGMWDDGMEDGHIADIGYVIKSNAGWKIKFYGTVCRFKHPIEDAVFDELDTAKEMLEKYGISMLVARYLSPV